MAWKNMTGVARAFSDPTQIITFGLVGSPDILSVVAPSGTFVAIEVKTGDGVQRKSQLNFQRAVETLGAIYGVARSIEDAVALVNQAAATHK